MNFPQKDYKPAGAVRLVPKAALGEHRPLIRMDKVPAISKGGKGGLLTAQEVPTEILDLTKPPAIKYGRGRFLGKGGFAKCYEVIPDKGDTALACKIVHKNMLVKEHHREKMAQEIMIHRTLNHPNVVAFHSYFDDDFFVYIVLELCEKKSLMELSKRRRTITEPEARYFLRQICEAVRYLHEEKKIIHRDLKLGNIFISSSMDLKVGDFGLATQLDRDGLRKRTMCGTPNYIAPEVLSKTGHGFEVDIWSVGCILYTLLIGRPPFETESLKETYRKIKAGDFAIPKSNLSPQAKKLIQRLLQVDPLRRPTAREILMDDFIMKCFIPDSLPVSSLTMAPRFPSAAAPARAVSSRRPLQERPNAAEIVSVKPISSETAIFRKAKENIRMDVDDSCCSDSTGDSGAMPMVDLLKSLRTQMFSTLTGIRSATSVPPNDDESEDPSLSPMLFIIKWVDYSDKYGFGYQLSDDSIGVTFNDQTKMILHPDGSNLTYFTKEGVESYHNLKQHPDWMEKKIKLISYFEKYMTENLLRAATPALANTSCIPRIPNMYTWFRTSRSVVMTLTNGTLQINNFKTHRKIVLCPAMGAISIIERGQAMRTYKLAHITGNGCTAVMKLDLEYAFEKLEAICKANESTFSATPANPIEKSGAVGIGTAAGKLEMQV
ncbi:Serine/threonine-protein kinase PLK1 [Orchesella cincta]|uniref:Serine/threonine-protein kinase PLK n=1 Tax=Orchesella cincta TaxID=48709 RepID=A0A1D2N6N6_ORCCI|nr:Serine/threonine-protein kinase PLK1 [Orchesella cincta]